ncbi:MAG: ISKra4 family transposase [Anaerolinea sp.]|nr:ISKra4 family transposase [Anaerolinea sp.]
MSGRLDGPSGDPFGGSRDRFERTLAWLDGAEAGGLSHGELEARLQVDARELFRQLLQDHLDLRAQRETRLQAVVDAEGVPRGTAEAGHERALGTVFGAVEVTRIAYRKPGLPNLHPADGLLNLPTERHSHGLRRLAAIESSRGSFEGAVEAICRGTGQQVGKRQVEALTQRAASDFGAFYARRPPPATAPDDVLVISCDGKGIVMRANALRPPTAAAAARATAKLATRLSRGEKRGRKRMAEVGAVYDISPAPRTSADILPTTEDERADTAPGPTAQNRWLLASVVEDAQTVVGQIFDEADRRDPDHGRTWVALVDGNNHQIDRIKGEARSRKVAVPIVVDFIHVLEYLWRAAWCFYLEGDPDAEGWVRRQALAVLAGRATRVAGVIRRKATHDGLDRARRANADACASYLVNKRAYLDYPTALGRGWLIATGVIEGACRHLIKDRMDLTGARWGLEGAEAVLKLRVLCSNGDFDDYWRFHIEQERQRVHEARYADNVIPRAA